MTQAPQCKPQTLKGQPSPSTYLFWLCGLDDQNLRSWCTRLLQLLKSKRGSDVFTTANLSFQLSWQSNRSLGQAVIFSCNNIEELDDRLTDFTTGQKSISSISRQDSPRPVVLCFGGQISTFIGLDREVFDKFRLLQTYVDQCNEICLSLGLESIYPKIFERTPVSDIVKLQTMLFAIQYSCAKSWIDSRLQIAAVVGHSFGELQY